MVGSFAFISDLEEIWRTIDAADRAKAERLLAAASRKIRLQCPSWAQAEEAEPGICKDICCNMVKRAMVAEETNPEGLSQGSQTTGPFADSWSYSNPNGDLYLTSSELSDLDGAGSGRMFTIAMTGEDV